MIEKLQPMRFTCRDCKLVIDTVDNQVPSGWEVTRSPRVPDSMFHRVKQNLFVHPSDRPDVWDVVCNFCVANGADLVK